MNPIVKPVRYSCFFCKREMETEMTLCTVQIVPDSAGILRYVCKDCLKEKGK